MAPKPCLFCSLVTSSTLQNVNVRINKSPTGVPLALSQPRFSVRRMNDLENTFTMLWVFSRAPVISRLKRHWQRHDGFESAVEAAARSEPILACSQRPTHFTPARRLGHLWWAGWDRDFPGRTNRGRSGVGPGLPHQRAEPLLIGRIFPARPANRPISVVGALGLCRLKKSSSPRLRCARTRFLPWIGTLDRYDALEAGKNALGEHTSARPRLPSAHADRPNYPERVGTILLQENSHNRAMRWPVQLSETPGCDTPRAPPLHPQGQSVESDNAPRKWYGWNRISAVALSGRSTPAIRRVKLDAFRRLKIRCLFAFGSDPFSQTNPISVWSERVPLTIRDLSVSNRRTAKVRQNFNRRPRSISVVACSKVWHYSNYTELNLLMFIDQYKFIYIDVYQYVSIDRCYNIFL